MKQPVGYSGTPLIQKLGLKPGTRACILQAPSNYASTLGPLPAGARLQQRLGKPHSLNFIHFFTKQTRQLAVKFADLSTALAYDGTLWISWPKKASKVETDLNENIVRQLGLEAGLVDVKVAAVDETWSGLKFMYRLQDRPK